MGREILDAAGDAVVKAGTDVDHQITAVHGEVGLIQAVHAEHAEPVLAGGGIAAKAHQGGGDGEIGGGDKIAQQAAGLWPRIDDAAAGVEDGAFGGFHHFDKAGDLGGVAGGAGLVMRDAGLILGRVVGGGELDVFRDVDEDGAGAALGGDVEGLMQGFGQFRGVLDQPVMFGAGAGDADCIGLLKAIGADHEGGNLTRQHDDGDAVHQGIGQTRDRIRGPGAGGDKGNAGFAGGAGIAFGHVDGTLFVANEDVLDVVLLKDRVINRQDGTTGIAKDNLNALFFQGAHHHFGTSHLFGNCRAARHLAIRFAHRPHPFSPHLRVPSVSANKKPPGVNRGRMGTCLVNRYRPIRQHLSTIRTTVMSQPPNCIFAELRGGVGPRQPHFDI